MTSIAKIAGACAIILAAGSMSASAACNRDTSTETALGAGSGALVGGLASNSIGGALVGGVAGGLVGHAIGSSNNREDCRRAAVRQERREYRRDRDTYYMDRSSQSRVERHFRGDVIPLRHKRRIRRTALCRMAGRSRFGG